MFKALCIFLMSIFTYATADELVLKDNLSKARSGDYLVTLQNKNYTVLLINKKDADTLVINEITIPTSCLSTNPPFSWKGWVEAGAPKNTSWLAYTIYLPTGTMQNIFSYTRNEWVSIPQSQNFLTTLLNLHLQKIPDNERKRIGPPPSTEHIDRRPVWQPKLIVDGNWIKGVAFEGYHTRWPKDGSELSDKMLEVYLPKDSDLYPAYFPYWLQVSGLVGKARVRIVDSGNNLSLKKPQETFQKG